jgi:hypothetical protein
MSWFQHRTQTLNRAITSKRCSCIEIKHCVWQRSHVKIPTSNSSTESRNKIQPVCIEIKNCVWQRGHVMIPTSNSSIESRNKIQAVFLYQNQQLRVVTGSCYDTNIELKHWIAQSNPNNVPESKSTIACGNGVIPWFQHRTQALNRAVKSKRCSCIEINIACGNGIMSWFQHGSRT